MVLSKTVYFARQHMESHLCTGDYFARGVTFEQRVNFPRGKFLNGRLFCTKRHLCMFDYRVIKKKIC